MNTYSNLDNWLLDPRVVGSSIMFTKYVSEWALDLRVISLNVGVTTFGPPCTLLALIWSAPIWALEAIILLIRAAQIKAGQIFRLIEILRHE